MDSNEINLDEAIDEKWKKKGVYWRYLNIFHQHGGVISKKIAKVDSALVFGTENWDTLRANISLMKSDGLIRADDDNYYLNERGFEAIEMGLKLRKITKLEIDELNDGDEGARKKLEKTKNALLADYNKAFIFYQIVDNKHAEMPLDRVFRSFSSRKSTIDELENLFMTDEEKENVKVKINILDRKLFDNLVNDMSQDTDYLFAVTELDKKTNSISLSKIGEKIAFEKEIHNCPFVTIKDIADWIYYFVKEGVIHNPHDLEFEINIDSIALRQFYGEKFNHFVPVLPKDSYNQIRLNIKKSDKKGNPKYSTHMAIFKSVTKDEIIRRGKMIYGHIFEKIINIYGIRFNYQHLPIHHATPSEFLEICTYYVGRYVSVKGQVTKISPLVEMVFENWYYCNSCREKFKMIFPDGIKKEPQFCLICEKDSKKTTFDDLDLDSIIERAMMIEIVDPLADSIDTQSTLKIMIHGKRLPKVGYGDIIEAIGTYGSRPIINKRDKIVGSHYVIDAEQINNVDNIHKKPTKEEKKIIRSYVKDDPMKHIINTILPTLKGPYAALMKKIVALMLFSGEGFYVSPIDGSRRRSGIHVLLISDPGMGKSQIKNWIIRYYKGSKKAVAINATKAGLTISARMDKDTGQWVTECGAVILAKNRIFVLDEAEKIGSAEQGVESNLLESMEEGMVSYAMTSTVKGVAHTNYRGLFICNWKHGKFPQFSKSGKWEDGKFIVMDDEDMPSKVDEIPIDSEPFNNRCDVRAGFVDMPNDIVDGDIIDSLIGAMNQEGENEGLEPEILMKWVDWANTEYAAPKKTEEIRQLIKAFYKDARKKSWEADNLINPRDAEAIVRLMDAYARIDLVNECTPQHFYKAVDFLAECQKSLDLDIYEKVSTVLQERKVLEDEIIKSVYKFTKDGIEVDELQFLCPSRFKKKTYRAIAYDLQNRGVAKLVDGKIFAKGVEA